MADDDLWGVKNAYFLGCHQQAISEAMAFNGDAASRVLANFYMYRAYIEQGQYHMVTSEVGNDAPIALQAAKLLATYRSSSRDVQETALVQLKEWLDSPQAAVLT